MTSSLPDPRELADGLLEVSVIGSFTRIGFEARRRLFGWEDLSTRRLDGRIVLVTGATSGLGLEAATTLARMGASVRILGRSADKAEAARSSIVAETGNDDVGAYLADLGDLDATRRVADEIREHEPRLDALVHNAGALLTEYRETPQGHEVTFATMVLAPHLLTRELRPLLGAGARVIWVTSGGMYTQALDVDTLELGPDGYRGSVAYAKAKRAQVVLTELWAKRLRDDGVAVQAMHPGWADTPGIHESLPTFSKLIGPLLRDRAEGADTIVWLTAADEPGRTTGRLWLDRHPRSTDKLPSTRTSPEERDRLWALVERLTTLSD
jgi:NAD(P)-dependent dehydrogenase (short-subunit alcohol dehydrogenase family)